MPMNVNTKKRNTLVYYAITMAAFGGLIYWVAQAGGGLELNRVIRLPESSESEGFLDTLFFNGKHALAILLIQILIVILFARICGWVSSRLGQPKVIGEIIAGILLGPSLFGFYFPELQEAVFPPSSLPNLQFLSQIGLILFMFVIGMELDLGVLHTKAKDAVVISHASIIFPFTLGMILAYFMYETYAPENIQFISFALFMGIAMSITAFPVLARIVQERGITRTRLGTIALTCAAADDITAWCILAAVIAIVKAGSLANTLYTVALAVSYVLVMIYAVRPLIRKVAHRYFEKKQLDELTIVMVFFVLIASSYMTEVIGIHALFGAFMAGAIMPEQDGFRSRFIQKVEDVAVVLLLPLFFIFTGLRTQIGLLSDLRLWMTAGAIIIVAVVGKFVGSALTARFVGQSWKDSLSIGALMNTRGLMELIVLNIGYDLGVLSPEVFAMMVIMALVTTMMTGPSLNLINRIYR